MNNAMMVKNEWHSIIFGHFSFASSALLLLQSSILTLATLVLQEEDHIEKHAFVICITPGVC